MGQKLNYDDIIFRIGYFRNKHHLSARELSLRMGENESFINRLERKQVALKMETILNFCELLEIELEEFFYCKPENYKKDIQILKEINSLSNENKDVIINLVRKLKK